MRSTNRPNLRHLGAGVATIALLAACSGGGGSDTASGARTPRITVATGTALDAALLTTADLLAAGSLPADAHTVTLDDLRVFTDPDPRAPCGAKVAGLDVSSGAAVGIRSASVTGVQYAVQLDEATAKAHLDALVADTRAGCPAFQSTTDNGAPQTVTLRAVLPLQPAADQGLAFEKSIESATGRVTADEVVLRRGPTITVLVLFTATGLVPDAVAALAAAMGAHLTRLG